MGRSSLAFSAILAAAVLSSCVPALGHGQEVAPSKDASLVQAVVEAIPAYWVWGRLGVYQIPIESEDELPFPAMDLSSVLDSVELEAREHMLQVDLALPLAENMDPGDCTGVLFGRDSVPDCHEAAFTKVALGLPRAVESGVVPDWKGAGRQAGRRADVVVRILFVSSSPVGSGVSSADFYVVRDEFGWEVVAKRVLVIVE